MAEKDVPPRYRLGVRSISPVEGDDEGDEAIGEEFESESEAPDWTE